MSLTKKIAHNTFIQVAGKCLGLTFSMLTLGLLTRYLGPEEFGYYTTIFAIIQMFASLADFGLQMSTVQIISDPLEEESEILGNVLSFRIVTALFFLGGGIIVAQWLPYPAAIRHGIVIASLVFFFNSLFAVVAAVFQKHLSMTQFALADFLNKLFLFALVGWAVTVHASLTTILWINVLSIVAACWILWRAAQRLTKLRLRFNPEKWRKIFQRTWPLALSIVLNLIYFKADTIVLSLTRSQHEVGLYGAPYKILEVLINFSYLFLGLLLPFMTRAYTTGDMVQFRLFVQKGFDVMAIIALPVVFGAWVEGEKIMLLVAGPAFSDSGNLLKILMLACAAIFLAAVFGYALVAINEQRRVLVWYLVNAVLSLAAYLLLIPRFSYWAAAWITVVSEIFILLTSLLILKRASGFWPNWSVPGRAAAAGLIMTGGLLLCRPLSLFITIPLGIIIYGLALLWFKGVSRDTLIDIVSLRP